MNTEIRLQQIGDELQRAFAADLNPTLMKLRPTPIAAAGRGLRPAGDGGWQRPPRPSLPCRALRTQPVSSRARRPSRRSLPAGARIFGSTPTCTVVKPNVEYRCTLAKAPPPDPVTHLTPAQWRKYLATPPHLGKIKIVTDATRTRPDSGKPASLLRSEMPRIERISRAYRNKVLASFGFTPAQIQGP